VAARRTPQMIAQLETRHAQIVAAARKGNARVWRDLDWSFHELVCTLSGNGFLLNAWQSISNLVRLFLHENPGFEHKTSEILPHHDALMVALKQGDPDHAEAVFRSLILNSAFKRLGRPIPDELASVAAHTPESPSHASGKMRSAKKAGTKTLKAPA
jgi:DNA-binding GntR family transcriptional regulator